MKTVSNDDTSRRARSRRVGTISLTMVTILALLFPLLPVTAAFAQEPLVPTIASDLPDYPPGALVTLTGANWQGDMLVHVVVNDDVWQTWYRAVDVPVAADGTIVDSFNLPDWFVATYSVVARGLTTDRVVTAIFTDASSLQITKGVTPAAYSSAGMILSYSYIVLNNGTEALNGPFTVVDDKATDELCVQPGDGQLSPNESMTCSASYTTSAADVTFGYVANNAYATGGEVTSAPDIEVASLPLVCENDTGGANDDPGQKDLTRQCDAPLSSNPLVIAWNWDVISTGGNNTIDACALFDTDNDGNINYALCASWLGTGQQVSTSPVLYSCGDTRPDRCPGSAALTISYGSDCEIDRVNDDPFPAGDSYQLDTRAYCSINLNDVGGAAVADFVDVCSFTQGNKPGSAPSDCIRYRTNTGKLEVVKDEILPTLPTDAGQFDLQIDGTTLCDDCLDGGTTTEQIVTAGNHTVGEIAGAGTSLTDYDSAIVCKDLNGTGTIVAQSTNSGR